MEPAFRLRSAIAALTSMALLPLAFTASEARADETLFVAPALDLGLGIASHVGPRPFTTAEFALDADAGAFLFLGKDFRFALSPQLGYSYDNVGLNAFNLTVGAGVGSWLVYVMYNPRLIAGTQNGHGAIGMRNSLSVNFFYDLTRLEIGHQFVESGGAYYHDVHFMIGLNPLTPIRVVLEPFRLFGVGPALGK